MEENLKQKINITIAGRSYPYTVSRDVEPKMREAVSKIKSKIEMMAQRYKNRDMQDILSIVLLETQMKYMSLEEKDEIGDILHEIRNLDIRLDEYINGR